MMKELSNKKRITRQMGTHKTQCVHRMRFRSFAPHDEIENIQVNQMSLYPNAKAVEDAKIFDGKLPAAQEDTNDEEPEEQATQINHQPESPTFSEVYSPDVIA